ncbi:Phasin protein [Enhydrobacter aerosaccus]|uniref:Phasin protein n=1 Tax=Enhydrobacter aerosaccus TaxID=225324 RepID=A0A1T4SSZ1_9HYPH|nr:phasin family protein [Enhydrobacter aerosaccus]SKA31011.1 Phasin protein [Enhydrobacter aerosaccus]
MANDQPAAATASPAPSPAAFPTPFIDPNWMKTASAFPTKLYASIAQEMLGMAARHLQAQSDYIGKLATCGDPAEFFACTTDFVKKSGETWVDNNRRIATALQAHGPASTQA